jgi:hypothetical protein
MYFSLVKVLYTFDDQNKTNCLARWPDILQIKTVSMEDSSSIGIIELKTCLQAIIQCSPELMARIGTDYTIYAYDYSEYDTPLVGQGMLSRAMASPLPTLNVPASEPAQMITGRVCKNILGIFANGVKETLEVKLRLVPVPKAIDNQYLDTMEKYREMSKASSVSFETSEWNAFVQSNPGIGQMGSRATPTPSMNMNQRDGVSMEVVNQLLSPQVQSQHIAESVSQANINTSSQENGMLCGKKTSRPSSRASVKRPRGRKPKSATTAGGNTSGYEEGTDGDEGPAPKKRRAKVTKGDQQNSNSAFKTAPDSLRVAASTAGSLRLFRPIAANPHGAVTSGVHLQEIARAPTPVPILPNQHVARDSIPSQGSLRRASFASQHTEPRRQHISPYPPLERPEDQLRNSIESANPSPEPNFSPADTPPDIASSPPVMRTRPVTPLRMDSSPPCASSPVLPQMPRTDSGFMSGSLEDLFGEDDALAIEDDLETVEQYERPQVSQPAPRQRYEMPFTIQEVMPGPAELLPTRMPIIEDPSSVESKARAAITRANSVMSEDGQVLPPLRKGRPPVRRNSKAPPKEKKSQQCQSFQPPISAPLPADGSLVESLLSLSQQPETQPQVPLGTQPGFAPPSAASSRTMKRTASSGFLTLPTIPASDPALPPSTLQRSHTWSEVPYTTSEFPMAELPVQETVPQTESSAKFMAKKAAIRQKLEEAIRNGKMPPFCSNCGAIDTPTWRKAWSQELQGAPGYYDYSDEPGRVTAIVVLTRDTEGKPTSYNLIKKSLLPEENQEHFKEFLLCNRKFWLYHVSLILTSIACGIWMSKYKTQRPSSRWETGAAQDRSRGGAKKPRASKPKKQTGNHSFFTSEANYPPSETNFTYSEANFPQSEAHCPQSEAIGAVEGISPADTTGGMQQPQTFGCLPQNEAQRKASARPAKRLNAMTSDAASAALRRAIQSSPARWAGTRNSPIDVEDDMGETRRLLFPSPRKDGSPKVLGEVLTNIVTISADLQSPKETLVQDKENCPPAIDEIDIDADLLRMFEEEMAKDEIPRPTTPTQKSPAINAFKTPTRPTPNHRPITRSVSRSQRSGKSPGQLLTYGRTPSRTPVRRSPRNHDGGFESPFTATLNQLMSEANNQNSPTRHGLELDFGSLPDLPDITGQQAHMDMNFSLEDFFSTDIPMPSSPPRMFRLYEDNIALNSVNWSEFGQFAPKDLEGGEGVVVKTEPQESPAKTNNSNEAEKSA